MAGFGPRAASRRTEPYEAFDSSPRDRAIETAAELGSRALLKSMLAYGLKNGGLPNLTPDMCRAGLVEMEA